MKPTLMHLLATFQTDESTPPPYAYRYELRVDLDEDRPQVDFALTYTDRDELTDDEILDEGFGLDDDAQWSGSLAPTWKAALQQQPFRWQTAEASLFLETTFADGQTASGNPNGAWGYLVQELVQGIYEAMGRANPLLVRYRRVTKGRPPYAVDLELSFAKRAAQIGDGRAARPVVWARTPDVLSALFEPEYVPEAAQLDLPKAAGEYLDPDEGVWYRFGEGVIAPRSDAEALRRLVNKLRALADG